MNEDQLNSLPQSHGLHDRSSSAWEVCSCQVDCVVDETQWLRSDG